MIKILTIEDDKSIQKLLKTLLEVNGYDVEQAFSFKEAVTCHGDNIYDIVIIDVMLGDGSGFDFARKYLVGRSTPYMFLTAVDDIYDKVDSINDGADDYMGKPFEPLELLARIKMILRRNRKFEDKKLLICGYEVDMDARTIMCNGKEFFVTNKEFSLLAYFIKNRGIVLSRDKILDEVWGYDYYGNTRTVDMHVKELRRKLELDCITTVYRTGYRMEWDDENKK